jgi:hypothetical protein
MVLGNIKHLRTTNVEFKSTRGKKKNNSWLDVSSVSSLPRDYFHVSTARLFELVG